MCVKKNTVIHLSIHKLRYCEGCLCLIAARNPSNHKLTCGKRPSGVFMCDTCVYTIKLRQNFNKHMKSDTHMKRGKQTFQCQQCQKYCRGSDLLEKHLKTHEGCDCSVCGKHLMTKWGMTRHKEAEHLEYDK